MVILIQFQIDSNGVASTGAAIKFMLVLNIT